MPGQGGSKRKEGDPGNQNKKRKRKQCRCGFKDCDWKGTDQSIYRRTKSCHGHLFLEGEQIKPIKIYPESQFARGGRYASWIARNGKDRFWLFSRLQHVLYVIVDFSVS